MGKVIPELNGKLDGMALRVPIPDGSFTDFVAVLKQEATTDSVNAAFREAANERVKGIQGYSDEPLVSIDIVDNPHSCIFDSGMTSVMEGTLVKVCGWYDNEWGYSNRCIDLIEKLAGM